MSNSSGYSLGIVKDLPEAEIMLCPAEVKSGYLGTK